MSRAFFTTFWEEVKKTLLLAFQRIFTDGKMPESFSKGLVCLIPKGGDNLDLRQWRPITLLSTAYKGLAKMMSATLRPWRPEIIHDTHTGFVEDRSILDNIFTFFEATEWAQQERQPLAIMLLDFEKAYDRVDWAFLEGTLLRLCFQQQWIAGISGLYRSANSKMVIGRRMGDAFRLQKSVRHGCPLAPYLFILFAEAMSYFLRDRATGICDLLDSEYADDTSLYEQDGEETFEIVRVALDTFCLARGAKINWNKSIGFLTDPHSSMYPIPPLHGDITGAFHGFREATPPGI